MSTKQDKLNEAYEYLRSLGHFHTKKEFSAEIGFDKANLSSAFNGSDAYLTDGLFEKICKRYPEIFNLEYFLTGEGEMLKDKSIHNAIEAKNTDAKVVYLYDVSASAGFGSFDEMISQEKVIGKYVIPDFRNIDWMIYVKGNSMYPKYSSGDIIGCRVLHESQFIQWGKVYVVATREQGILVKRLRKSNGEDSIMAVSDNPNYDPFDIPKNEILGIALVVGVVRME
jgi:phage repressor protein C with HTH and peptisase S24 domain